MEGMHSFGKFQQLELLQLRIKHTFSVMFVICASLGSCLLHVWTRALD